MKIDHVLYASHVFILVTFSLQLPPTPQSLSSSGHLIISSTSLTPVTFLLQSHFCSSHTSTPVTFLFWLCFYLGYTSTLITVLLWPHFSFVTFLHLPYYYACHLSIVFTFLHRSPFYIGYEKILSLRSNEICEMRYY